uniref:Cytochrome P450 n=1 Tax=Kalanchoe fedtschenkoi TaxID=63787 RepID=A0A7N0ZTE5_KALFE
MDMMNLPSANPVILVCTTLLCALAFLYIRSRSSRLSSSLPPSPRRLPIIGNLHQLGASAHEALHTLSLKHGPLMLLHFGSVPTYIVSSGDLAMQVMKTREAGFSGKPVTKASLILLQGGADVLLHPRWTQTKKVSVTGLLSLKKVQSLQFIREEEVASLVSNIRSLVSDGTIDKRSHQRQVNVSNMSLKLASTILSRALLGLKSTADGGRESNKIIGDLSKQAITLLHEKFAVGNFIPALSWLDHLRGLTGEAEKVSQAIHEFLDRAIDERETHQQSDAGDEKRNDDRKYFVDILLELQKKDMVIGHRLTRKDIRAILLILFLGGFDSSATNLEWAMAELVKNPRVMKKLQDEIRGVVGKKSEIFQTDLDQMEYLKCVIKETLRLHATTLAVRRSTEDVNVGGYKILANANVLINIWAIHRDPAVWERPLEFVPERFLDAGYTYLGQDQKYFPFGLGRGICPGIQFAMFGSEYSLANFLCWFNWELPEGMSVSNLDMSSNDIAAHRNVPLYLVPVHPAN